MSFMTPEEFRRIGHELIDLIADYRKNIADYPVMAQVKPGEMRKKLPASPPEEPTTIEVANDLSLLLPGLGHFQHPQFFGYFPANAELSSVLGDLLSSGLGQLGLTWQASPALTEVEEHMADWFRQLLGLPEYFQGVIQDTASSSSLVALLCAREKKTNYSQFAGGLQAEKTPLVVYVSEQSHSSVAKVALLAGFGRENIRAIATDDSHALSASALEAAIEQDLNSGLRPCALVATTGTTATTALDPVKAMADLAERYHLWLHVDAAMAGSAMMLEEHRWMWQGIEAADSIVFNPHKWLGAVFDCSLYYVRDSQALTQVMSTSPSYLKTSSDTDVKNFRDWGVPLGRRFRALKLWFLLRSEGASGLRARLRRDMANAQWLAEQVDLAKAWQRVAPAPLQTVCVRYDVPGKTDEEIDEHTLAWVKQLNESGRAFLTPAKLKGRWMVRVSIGAIATEHEDVKALWQAMREVAEV